MILYNSVIRSYGLIIRLASANKLKARQWVEGRRNWREQYRQKTSALKNSKRVWVHCASYGEFEQGRPLIEAIKKQDPDCSIILTFFSPSGYEAFKDWTGAEVIGYLPLDTRSNARDFITIVKPNSVIFIKYEFWLNFLFELKRRNIPTYLVSAVFKPHHPFFKWYGAIFRKSLLTFKKLFIQDEKSGKLLQSIGINNYEVSGDTRFDRVLEIKKRHEPLPYFVKFCSGNRVIVGGSTWGDDEELLVQTFDKMKAERIKLIIVPHEVNEKSISRLENLLKGMTLTFARYSGATDDFSAQVLIVDAMGLLSRIYYYADVAYVGGGFSEGIHNILEPAVYGIPVTFYGDDFEMFNEAVELTTIGAAKNVHNSGELYEAFNSFIGDNDLRNSVKDKLEKYFELRANTTERILKQISL